MRVKLLPLSAQLVFLTSNPTRSFQVSPNVVGRQTLENRFELRSSLFSDGSEYASKKSDIIEEDTPSGDFDRSYREEQDDTPTVELEPVPMSKNSGNRFVAIVWDKEVDQEGRDVLQLHYDHIELTEDHVMFCRKKNLYNETFNAESMVDILWSLPILASDLKRVIGQAYCFESTKKEYIIELMAEEPIIKMFTGGDVSKIPLYRWRQIRDYTLRTDDGRFGHPCLCLALDKDQEQVGNVREEQWENMLEYMIESDKIIAAGPLHQPTEFKDDPSSIPVGDLFLFNAKNREDAIDFVEGFPSAKVGQYKSMRCHFYNRLDITGKFVSVDRLHESPCEDMKEAMEYWGYPVADDQTPWLNW